MKVKSGYVVASKVKKARTNCKCVKPFSEIMTASKTAYEGLVPNVGMEGGDIFHKHNGDPFIGFCKCLLHVGTPAELTEWKARTHCKDTRAEKTARENVDKKLEAKDSKVKKAKSLKDKPSKAELIALLVELLSE